MKRFFISISLFCIGLNALADVVSSSKAYDVAQQFMNAAILTEVCYFCWCVIPKEISR